MAQQIYSAVAHGDLNVLALARRDALEQRAQNADTAQHAGAGVADCRAGFDRRRYCRRDDRKGDGGGETADGEAVAEANPEAEPKSNPEA